jgi:hypothetical protein
VVGCTRIVHRVGQPLQPIVDVGDDARGRDDVKGGPAFTHISYDDFRIIRANLLEGGHRTTADRLIPYTIFMDPQLGRVGLNEREAREQGRRVGVATLLMRHVARALEVDEPRGVMKAVVDAETDRILGCAVLGIEGGELMAMVEIAMLAGFPTQRCGTASLPIPPSPSRSTICSGRWRGDPPTPPPQARSGTCLRRCREEPAGAIGAQGLDDGEGSTPLLRERILDPRRDLWVARACDDALLL